MTNPTPIDDLYISGDDIDLDPKTAAQYMADRRADDIKQKNKGDEPMYKIVRHYYGFINPQTHGHLAAHKRTIETGLTLEQAQTHCKDPETSSSTCTSAAKRRITRQHGEWFDGYSET